MRIPKGLFTILKEILRHLLRRPVVGISAVARTADGQVLLIRRGDTGEWALPGGTLEWGERLRDGVTRELLEEAGVEGPRLGGVLGVYSDVDRDPRFHAVTIVVEAEIEPPQRAPVNPAEILECRLFPVGDLPATLSHGNREMLSRGLTRIPFWE